MVHVGKTHCSIQNKAGTKTKEKDNLNEIHGYSCTANLLLKKGGDGYLLGQVSGDRKWICCRGGLSAAFAPLVKKGFSMWGGMAEVVGGPEANRMERWGICARYLSFRDTEMGLTMVGAVAKWDNF